MRWGVEKRLEFIEFRLFWEGGINRADIVDQFGVSVPQASKDLTLYEEKAPGNLIYDKSAKRYKAADEFKPVFMKPNASIYLAHLRETNGGRQALPKHGLHRCPSMMPCLFHIGAWRPTSYAKFSRPCEKAIPSRSSTSL